MIIALLGIAFICAPAWSQQDDKIKNVKLKVLNKKGKQIKDLEAYIYLTSDSTVLPIPKDGMITFDALSTDTVHFINGQRIYSIGLAGADSLLVVMKNKARMEGFSKNNEIVLETKYGMMPLKNNTTAMSAVDVSKIGNYRSLADYLSGRVAGVEVVGNNIVIRGKGSINSSTDPLVIVDGHTAGSFAEVNSYLNPMDIESVTVDKTGSLYGVRGANGVLIIKTKTGKANK